MKKWISIILAAALVLSFAACDASNPAERVDPEIPEVQENPKQQEPSEPEEILPEIGERREVSPENFENAAKIVLSENGITVDGKPADESDCVKTGGEIIYYHDIDNYESGNPYGEGEAEDKHTEEEAASHTLVTITKPGEYFITGELKGQLAVDLGEEAETDPDAKVTLIFGGADITCEIAPAVIFYNVYESADSEAEASSKVDTSAAGANVIAADGSLSNICGANVAKIYKDNAEAKKLHKYDAALYSKMSMNIGGDSENTGVLNVYAENEGIGSEMHLTINGGVIGINSEDDGINTNEDGVSVTTINGGKLTVKGGLGTEGDGIDSNGWLIINGGTLYASGNGRSGDGGIDADMGISINGGNVFAFGNRNDNISSESAQLHARLDFASTKEAGSVVELSDGEGNKISAESDREFQSVVLSGDMLSENVNYHLYVNGVVQEYSATPALWNEHYGNIKVQIPGGPQQIPDELEIPEGNPNNPYAVPEGLEEWLENSKDVPDEIREWIETMMKASEGMGGGRVNKFETETQGRPQGGTPFVPQQSGEFPELGIDDGNEDNTVFVLEKENLYFYGIFDSPSAVGKKLVTFTINGETRIEDLFLGDLPEITDINCSEKIPPEQVQVTLVYRGRDESINVARNCMLSEGIEAVKELFRDLEPGNYRLTIGVTAENEEYSGSTVFNFDVVD